MPRYLTVAAAQSGPIAKSESRAEVIHRLIRQMREAKDRGCDLIVYTEVALTAFFPHWHMTDEQEISPWFEQTLPSPATQPLFDEAARLGIGFHLGYAEQTVENGERHRYNSAALVGKDGRIIGKYRKVHLPGWDCYQPGQPFQNLEKFYFEVGNLGFPVWRCFGGILGMMICNDRRWPEAYRAMSLQGAEMIVLGYNTPVHNPANPASDPLAGFHNHLCMQAGAYQNACWVVGVAKAGTEEGVTQIGQSCIIAPTGEIVAQAATLEDELITYQCDLDLAKAYKENVFNFAAHRRIEHYQRITEQTGVKIDV
jgi:predicted amidohydrolase